MLLEGLQLPITTPFHSNGRLNLLKLEHNVDRYSKTPVAGLSVLTHAGEASLLSDDETVQVLRSAVQAAAPEKVMTAGIARNSVISSIALIGSAAEIGYDSALVYQPSIFSRDIRGLETRELLSYFQMVADRSPLPIVISGGSLTDDVIAELAAHPQIAGAVVQDASRIEGVKSRTSSVSRQVTVTSVFAAVTRRMPTDDGAGVISAASLVGGSAIAVAASRPAIKTRTKKVGFQILIGRTAEMLDGLLRGAVGTMPAFAAAAPQGCYEVVAAWKDGDEGLAMEKQLRVVNIARRIEDELGVAGVKFGCDLNGYYGGVPRLPVLPLNGQERAEVESLMLELRN